MGRFSELGFSRPIWGPKGLNLRTGRPEGSERPEFESARLNLGFDRPVRGLRGLI